MVSRILILILLLLSARQTYAQAGLRPDGHLDTAALRDAYLQSDMAAVRGVLEGFLKSHPKDVSKGEKIFTHLYLGALYAGDPAQRARAEGQFRSLLKLDPGVDPADLYFPPKTKDIFDGVKWILVEEAARKADSIAVATATANQAIATSVPPAATAPSDSLGSRPPAAVAVKPAPPPPAATPSAAPRNAPGTQDPALADASGGKPWVWWTLGSTAAAVAAGVGVYALVESNAQPGPRRLNVDATLK